MTIDEAIEMYTSNAEYERTHGSLQGCKNFKQFAEWLKELKAYKEQGEDCISRQAVIDGINEYFHDEYYQRTSIQDCRDCLIKDVIKDIPPVTPQQKMGHCKDCKFFEYDSVAKVNGIPLIVAHEICSRWGDGCKTKEDGYCFLFEPKMQEVNG